MKKFNLRVLTLTLIMALCAGFCVGGATYAEGEESEETIGGTNISISPVSNVLQLASSSTYNDKIEIKNEGDNQMNVEVYAAPYSYVYSEEEDVYKLGFNNENNFTQITRWITFKDAGGSWVSKAEYSIEPKKSLEVEYKISTPDSIPAGGQYAVIFAHTLNGVISSNGIRTEASPGLVVYGRSIEGETVVKAEVRDMVIQQNITDANGTRNNFYASAKIKNTGNVDFSASGSMKVTGIFGGTKYETPQENARVSVIPETELAVSDEWTESPSMGIYRVSWTVDAGGESQTIQRIVFVNPILFIIITIILLTIIITFIIIGVRRRKERRSRLAV